MEQSQELYNQIQQQVASDRTLPPKVLEDTVNEKAEYEKDLLQGAGGLLAGGSVERGFKLLAKTPKGVKALKKLGMSDEDVETVITAIKSRDSGALTDFLTRKGTGFIESTAKKLGIKGGKVAKTTVKKLKEGKLPTREELQDAINEGGGKEVKPTKSNLKKKPTEDEAGAGEDESTGIFDALKSKAENTIRSVKGSLQDTIGDAPSRVSSLVDKADEFKSKGFGRVNSAFDRARADIKGDDDLEGQAEAVKKLLSKSKSGRRLLRKNARSKAEGGKAEPPKKQTSEFDAEDEQGDLFSELTKLGSKSKRMISKPKEDLPTEPTEIDALTGQPVDPLEKIRAGKQKIDEDFQKAQEQIEAEGDRDPYQDIYDQANRDAQKFTPDELGVGKKFEKDIDFKFKAPTREEHLKALAEQEKGKPEPMLKTDETDPDLTDEAFADEQIKPTIPPSEQTGGIDPSTLPDDAGFQRGSAKIQAKKEVEPRPEPPKEPEPIETEPIEPPVPEPPKSAPEDIDDLIQKTKIPEAPKPPPQQEEEEQQRLTVEQEAPKPPEPEPPKPPPQLETTKPPIEETPQPPKPTVNKPNLETDKDLADGGDMTKGEKVEEGLKGAFEDSLEGDEDPFGIIVSGILGIGALIGGAFKKAHHPHFIQPPALHPYENFSVQEGVA